MKPRVLSHIPVGDPVEFNHLLEKAREVYHNGQDSWEVMSTGEKLAVAMIINEPVWVMEMGYTMAEAIDRIGPEWSGMLLQIQRILSTDL